MTSYKRQLERAKARRRPQQSWWRRLLGLPAPRRKAYGHKPPKDPPSFYPGTR